MNKRVLTVLSSFVLVSFAAQAESDYYSQILNPEALSAQGVDHADGFVRRELVEAAPDAAHAMDFWTPEEAAADLGLENKPVDFLGEDIQQVSAQDRRSVVSIDVNIATQRLTVSSPEGVRTVKISSARAGYHTATGCYRPSSLETMHYSKKYDNSPMPHSIFYRGGYAIHGTYAEGALGRPASHGCVRVSRASASYLFSLASTYGSGNTRICIH